MKYKNINELKNGIDEYIHYHNYERISLRLKGLSPVEYRTQVQKAAKYEPSNFMGVSPGPGFLIIATSPNEQNSPVRRVKSPAPFAPVQR